MGLYFSVRIQDRKGTSEFQTIYKNFEHRNFREYILNLDYTAYNDNVICCGAHWQGKSWFIANTFLKNLPSIANIWVWDYHGVMTKYTNPPTHLIKRDVKELEYGTQFFIPTDRSDKGFENFLKKALTHRDLVICNDEAHNNSSAHRLKGYHAELIRNAGNQNISYISIFQRPQRVNGDVLENARHRFCFALDNLNSVKYMREWIGLECELFLAPAQRSPQAKKLFGDADMLPRYS